MKAKKVLALMLAAIMLVCTSVAFTVAYFVDQEKATNTFTIGKIGITLDETKVDEYGEAIAGAKRVKENEYKLIPGHTYVKDPRVTVDADSEESYIRMIVTISDLTDVKAAFDVPAGQYFLPQNYVKGWDNTVWLTTNAVKEDAAANTATYEFRYFETVNTLDTDKTDTEPAKALTLDALFDEIVVPGTLDNDDIKSIDEMEITIIAQAIQADGFKNADEAWTAFNVQVNP